MIQSGRACPEPLPWGRRRPFAIAVRQPGVLDEAAAAARLDGLLWLAFATLGLSGVAAALAGGTVGLVGRNYAILPLSP